MEIRRAALADLPVLVPLFDRYRQFYGQPSDPDRARRFLAERLERGESVVFMAFEARRALGFVQLYPGFSSVATARTLVLNDLYVEADGRRSGTGRGLVAAATAHAREAGAASLSLQTGVANHAAQRLYENLGWTRETRFLDYGLHLLEAATIEG
jgi:ribosomal protein S18 acetylase RimI-like enzyme